MSLLLRLLGRDADPARAGSTSLLSVLAERRLRAGAASDLASLLGRPGAAADRPHRRAADRHVPAKARARGARGGSEHAARVADVRDVATGTQLDVTSWLTAKDGKTPAVIVSVAHLDDDERALVLGVLLEEVLTWVRSLPGSKRLRALVVFDEVYGFLPPHPANPPTKRPLVALMKQARAFGVGVVIATQNPMDLDYRALGNAGMWCVGRLQTDADRARVLEGLCSATDAGGGRDGDGASWRS